jgi:hypothetical protein
MNAKTFNIILFGISFLIPLILGLFIGGLLGIYCVLIALVMRYVEDYIIKNYGDRIIG